jgi:hypothetical protein
MTCTGTGIGAPKIVGLRSREPSVLAEERARRYRFSNMRTARAKVVKGKIVTKAKFPDGTKLFLVVDTPQPEIELEDDDEKAFDEAMVAVRRGKTIPLETFREILQRL